MGLLPRKSSDQHLTTSVTCLSYRKTIWPLSDHLSEYLTNIWPQMQLVSFPGKPSDRHLTITLYGIWPPVSNHQCDLSLSLENHLNIIRTPLRLILSTLEIYQTSTWPPIQLVYFLEKPSDHYLTITLYESLTLENYLISNRALW